MNALKTISEGPMREFNLISGHSLRLMRAVHGVLLLKEPKRCSWVLTNIPAMELSLGLTCVVRGTHFPWTPTSRYCPYISIKTLGCMIQEWKE
jgi:hypothetical protein